MDKERCDAWAAAFAKLKTGLQVWDLPPEEHYALLRPGLFEGMDEVTAQEEAEWVVRYWVLPPSSVGEMTLRLYGALSYSQNSARDLRCALNGA